MINEAIHFFLNFSTYYLKKIRFLTNSKLTKENIFFQLLGLQTGLEFLKTCLKHSILLLTNYRTKMRTNWTTHFLFFRMLICLFLNNFLYQKLIILDIFN